MWHKFVGWGGVQQILHDDSFRCHCVKVQPQKKPLVKLLLAMHLPVSFACHNLSQIVRWAKYGPMYREGNARRSFKEKQTRSSYQLGIQAHSRRQILLSIPPSHTRWWFRLHSRTGSGCCALRRLCHPIAYATTHSSYQLYLAKLLRSLQLFVRPLVRSNEKLRAARINLFLRGSSTSSENDQNIFWELDRPLLPGPCTMLRSDVLWDYEDLFRRRNII